MRKLNFGCGEDVKAGWDNMDVQKSDKLTKSFDFNKFPYPVKENTYDYIYSYNVLEHLQEPDKVLNELWRISKPNAVIEISVPYYNNKGAYSDMQHMHYFSDTTFKVFVDETCKIEKKRKFEIIELKMTPSIVGKFLPRLIREKMALFVGGLLADVKIKLKVSK